jgi:Flp pilus assembly protein TadD
VAHLNLAKVHERLGQFSDAIAALEKAGVSAGGNTEVSSTLAYVLAASGEPARARAILAELRNVARRRYVPPYNLALIHAGLGEEEKMYDCLERAYEERDVRMTFLIDPKWDAFRANPRFQNLLSRVGLERKAA